MLGIVIADRYELLEKIGEGGMALVFKAKDLKLQRVVAVKVLKEEYLQDSEFVKKFKAEAVAAGSISDGNIVNVFDVGTDGKVNYIVMEYLQGKTLKEIINEKGKIHFEDAIEISIQIAKALDCAHRSNIIHRDIKPHNIMITDYGIVKVMDFGIAKAVNSTTITNTNVVLGSVHYISPEQAKGQYVNKTCDLYSLGAVMYEMVTGVVPYDGDTPVSIAIKHIQEELIEPKTLNPNIPESLNNVIVKLLQKNPDMRYQSAKELQVDLMKIKNGETLDNNNEDEFTKVLPRVDDINSMMKNNNTNTGNNTNDVEDFNSDKSNIDYDDDEDEDIKKRNVDKKKAMIFAIALAAVLLLVVGFVVMPALSSDSSSEKVSVPSILNLDKAEAKKKVEKVGLTFKIVEKKKSSQEEGKVINVSPKVGTEVKKGSVVKVTISLGPGDVEVPDVTGKSQKDAEAELEEAGFKIGDITTEYSDDVTYGLVMSQDPAGGDKVDEGETINLVISNGPKAREYNLVGKTVDDAKNEVGSFAKISVSNSTTATTDESKDGLIASQDKTSVKINETITVTLYKYEKAKEMVQVPYLNGQNLKDVINSYKNKLTIVATDEYGQTITGNYGDYTVSKGPDNAGSSVEKGSTIYVTCSGKNNSNGNGNSGEINNPGDLAGDNLGDVISQYGDKYDTEIRDSSWNLVTSNYKNYTVASAWWGSDPQGNKVLFIQTKE
ncbi:Protein kinase [Clostridium bornimense]|uniref:non-specific serine/threonine protein kinase n=1 Tax=Clostridium bornimense TaxID=1216932 RepID=W6RZM9_9CLOT|nr:Stk1 family PASTA domain-containing Ser/Thr kinase [Clostridium bornimense]CDM69074.1 Protein kinase [Clostridium bornimense]